jgi:hypothetical protein
MSSDPFGTEAADSTVSRVRWWGEPSDPGHTVVRTRFTGAVTSVIIRTTEPETEEDLHGERAGAPER